MNKADRNTILCFCCHCVRGCKHCCKTCKCRCNQAHQCEHDMWDECGDYYAFLRRIGYAADPRYIAKLKNL